MSVRARGITAAVAALVLAGLSACAAEQPGTEEPSTSPEPLARGPVAGPDPPATYPECQADSYDFVGRATLAGLGLESAVPAPLPNPNQVAMIWVTHELMPYDAGPPGGQVEGIRMLCFEFADGTGGSGWPVDPEWRAP